MATFSFTGGRPQVHFRALYKASFHHKDTKKKKKRYRTILTSPVGQATGATVGSEHCEPAGHMVHVTDPVESA
jgi:hypothetical protein